MFSTLVCTLSGIASLLASNQDGRRPEGGPRDACDITISPSRDRFECGEVKGLVVKIQACGDHEWKVRPATWDLVTREGLAEQRQPLRMQGPEVALYEGGGAAWYRVRAGRTVWTVLPTASFHDGPWPNAVEVCAVPGNHEVALRGTLYGVDGGSSRDFQTNWVRVEVSVPEGEDAKAFEVLWRRGGPTALFPRSLAHYPAGLAEEIAEKAGQSREACLARARIFRNTYLSASRPRLPKPGGMSDEDLPVREARKVLSEGEIRTLLELIASQEVGRGGDLPQGPLLEAREGLKIALHLGDRDLVTALVAKAIRVARAWMVAFTAFGSVGDRLHGEYMEREMEKVVGVAADSPAWPEAINRAWATAEGAFEGEKVDTRILGWAGGYELGKTLEVIQQAWSFQGRR